MSEQGPASGVLSAVDLEFFFEPHHRRLAESLDGAAAAVSAAAGRAGDEAGRARAVAAEMGAQGLYEWLLPAEGSSAVDVRALCLVREALGYASPLADAIFAVQGLGSLPIVVAGTPEQRAVAADLRRGAAIAGFALTEPGAGSDVGAHRHHARGRRRAAGSSTARRRSSPTPASPPTTSCSRPPTARPARRASPPSGCRPTRPA